MRRLNTVPLFLACAASIVCVQIATCQGLINHSSIHINGVSVYVDGDVDNAGQLNNNGRLAFTHDWQSQGNYNGSGVLEANGHRPQKITHFNQDVKSLVIDGWGTKYIKGAINITGEFHLSKGIVGVSSNDVLKLTEYAIIHGGGLQSYVDGAITTQGKGYKYFPLGKNGTYAPIEFLDIKGKSSEFSVEVFEDAPAISVEDVIVRKGLYWQRKDLNGNFGGSAVAINMESFIFQEPENIILLTGTEWDEPFTTIRDIRYSEGGDEISTGARIFTPIIMLGEISDRWTGADFYFSTALSPNASFSENRSAKIFGERLLSDKFHFQVFNRRGALVFESTTLEHMVTNGWDGRSMNGVELPTGTYPYRISAFDKTGSRFEKKGVITLVY